MRQLGTCVAIVTCLILSATSAHAHGRKYVVTAVPGVSLYATPGVAVAPAPGVAYVPMTPMPSGLSYYAPSGLSYYAPSGMAGLSYGCLGGNPGQAFGPSGGAGMSVSPGRILDLIDLIRGLVEGPRPPADGGSNLQIQSQLRSIDAKIKAMDQKLDALLKKKPAPAPGKKTSSIPDVDADFSRSAFNEGEVPPVHSAVQAVQEANRAADAALRAYYLADLAYKDRKRALAEESQLLNDLREALKKLNREVK